MNWLDIGGMGVNLDHVVQWRFGEEEALPSGLFDVSKKPIYVRSNIKAVILTLSSGDRVQLQPPDAARFFAHVGVDPATVEGGIDR